jgi:uncharacterized protein YoxC
MIEEDKTIKNRVEDATTINFSITKCPYKVYKEFVDFCKEETEDKYAMGLKLLIDAKNKTATVEGLFKAILSLQEQIDEINQRDGEAMVSSDVTKPVVKTFGKLL